MFEDKNIHLIGIGGVSMQGIAKTLVENGNRVSGSDLKDSDLTHDLQSKDIEVNIGHNPKNIRDDLDLIIISNAIPDTNPELVRARKLKI